MAPITNPSNTVRGLNIAILVLTILSLVGVLIGFACVGVISSYIQGHSSKIADQINTSIFEDIAASSSGTSAESAYDAAIEGIENSWNSSHHGTSTHMSDNNGVIEFTVDGEDVEAADLADALLASGNTDLVSLAQVLVYLDEGQYAQAFNLASTYSESSMRTIRDEAAALTDTQLQQMSAASGLSYSLLAKIRSGARDVTDDDIAIIARYVGVNGTQNAVSDGTAVVSIVLYTILVCLLIADILALIASILALRNARKPEKLMSAFVLSIISAVAMLLCTSLVRTILFIISAVYIYKTRKMPIGQHAAAQPADAAQVIQ